MSQFNLILVKNLESVWYLRERNFYAREKYVDGFWAYANDYWCGGLVGKYSGEVKNYPVDVRKKYECIRQKKMDELVRLLPVVGAPGYMEKRECYMKEHDEVMKSIWKYTKDIEIWYEKERTKLHRKNGDGILQMEEELRAERRRREDEASEELEYRELLQRARRLEEPQYQGLIWRTPQSVRRELLRLKRDSSEIREYRRYCKLFYELSNYEPYFYFGTTSGEVINFRLVASVSLRQLHEGHFAFLGYDDIIRIDCV